MIRFCPYAQRTVLVLNAKQVDYNIINSALMDKPAWLLELNPLGTVVADLNNFL
jgi:glutathione S-transferase